MGQHLQKQLLPRHVQMLALGGAIGAGIFQGSAETIGAAGPAVVFAYLFAGFILFVVMGAMAEMALVHKGLDLRGFIHQAFGARASFIIGWLYFLNWILVMAVEIVAAGTFLKYWFTSTPVWLLSLVVALFIILVNLASVRLFGEIEYWLTGMKIVTLLVFVLLGLALLFGLFPAHDAPLLQHYTEHGGFFPLGITGVLSSLLIVIFSYGGTEMIGITIREMKDAEKTLPKVIQGIIIRICLFYVLPLLVIVGLTPWNQVGKTGSPFVEVLSSVGLEGAAHIMNFIMLTAVVSAANSGMYATSRMIHSLANQGEAPAFFTKLSKNGVPIYGLLISSLSLLLGAAVAFVAQDQVFQYLMGIPGYTVLLIWIMILLSQLKLRKQYPVMPNYRVAWFPYLSIFSVLSLIAIFVSILLNPKNAVNSAVYITVLLFLFLFSGFKLWGRGETVQ